MTDQALAAHAAKEKTADDVARENVQKGVLAEQAQRMRERLEREKLIGSPVQCHIVQVFSTMPGELGIEVASAPAIITQVLSGGYINAHVFRNGENSVAMTKIPHASEGKPGGAPLYWDWPVQPPSEARAPTKRGD